MRKIDPRYESKRFTIFCTKIPEYYTPEKISSIFETFGKVSNVNAQPANRYVHIKFVHESSADKAVFAGSLEHAGVVISIKRAK